MFRFISCFRYNKQTEILYNFFSLWLVFIRIIFPIIISVVVFLWNESTMIVKRLIQTKIGMYYNEIGGKWRYCVIDNGFAGFAGGWAPAQQLTNWLITSKLICLNVQRRKTVAQFSSTLKLQFYTISYQNTAKYTEKSLCAPTVHRNIFDNKKWLDSTALIRLFCRVFCKLITETKIEKILLTQISVTKMCIFENIR